MELTAVDSAAAAPRRSSTGDIVALEMGAKKDRSGRGGRAGEKSLRAPDKQVMADQKIVSPFLACRVSLIIIGDSKTSGHTESIRTHFPLDTRLNKVVEPAPNGTAAGIENSLAGSVAMIS